MSIGAACRWFRAFHSQIAPRSTGHDQKIIVLDFAEGLDVSMFV